MSTPTLGELSSPLLVLRLFAVEYPHIPAPCMSVSALFSDLLELSFHGGDLAGFEAWRETLGVDPGKVSHHAPAGGPGPLRPRPTTPTPGCC
jgi:hypothetical protein